MSAAAPEIQRAFSGGELAPELRARADLARYKTSLDTMENFVSLMRGGATRRSGFMDVWDAMAVSALHPFAFSDSDAYAVEFGVGNTHFFRDFGVLESAPGVPFAKANPFSADEIDDICTTQSANALFITTGARPLQRLQRNSNLDWTLAEAVLKNGPFLDDNADQNFKISCSTGTATGYEIGAAMALVASAALFQAGHVGALFLIRIPDQSAHPKWANGSTALTTGARVYWGDNFYVCTGAGSGTKTGTNPPVHTLGAAWDGSNAGADDGRLWTYKHSGWGVVKITAVADATHAAAVAMTYVPDEINGGTWRWAEGAFSDVRGYPRFCGLHKSRLYLMSTASDPTSGFASRTDDYTNFDASQPGDGDDTAAFRFRMEGNNGKVNLPRWILSASQLGIGTAGDEHVLVPVSAGQIAPDNFDVAPATAEGSAPIQAVRVEGAVFVAADTMRVLELAYDPNTVQQNSYVANDLTLYANHVGEEGIAGLTWQREPYRLLWIRDSLGQLAACTFRKDQDVQAWHRHPTIKGAVESICAVPSPVKKRQDLWAIVTRTLASGTYRRIECLSPFFREQRKSDRIAANGFFVDAGLTYAGAAITTLAVPARFNGETVAILADGKVVPNQLVAGSQIHLPFAAQKICFGLPLTAKLKTLRCDKDALGGALSGKPVRAQSVIVDVLESAGLSAQAGDQDKDLVKPSGGAQMNAAAKLYDGPLEIEALDADWSDSDITITADQPLPATIRAITPHYQVAR